MQKTEMLFGLPWLSTKPERAIFDELQFACVYAAGPSGGRPLRLGYASGSGLRETLRTLQKGSWKELQIHHIAWTRGDLVASRIADEAAAMLDRGGRRLVGSWFDVTAELGIQAINIATGKTGITTVTHGEMLEQVRRIRRERIEKAIKRA
ncbi:hypothetical protein [Bradyrhizobium sp. SZCCHNR3118]|uniref:hypothetical protein n=1 Tax=Bradyrhizobium sp. SZCCHNR3118 TaxID=3057468 RepID=UPI002916ACA0|nr:hypothetical protein [Bradyrhizobium sp. SZCCHNR3118]